MPCKRASIISASIALVLCTLLTAADEPATQPTTHPTSRPTLSAEAKARRARRQMLTAAEYESLATELRKSYSQSSSKWPAPQLDDSRREAFIEIGALPPLTYPANNPHSKEKEELGKQLFFDPRLSGSGQIACASCHDPELSWGDGRSTSFGHDRMRLRRNAPSIQHAAYMNSLFWDGRSGSLEDQARNPVSALDEMASTPAAVEQRLNLIPEYRAQFKKVFGVEMIKWEQVAQAIATFERALAGNAGRSKFDKFMNGDVDALSDSAIRGLHLFRTQARCINCHYSPAFSDSGFHNAGLTYYGRELEDLGRYVVTDDPADVGKFRTPTLRNVARTGPYMHNGLFELDGLLTAYNNGMFHRTATTDEEKSDPMYPKTSPLLQPLHLNQQDMADLRAFLETLSEPAYRMRPPRLPPSATTRSSD